MKEREKYESRLDKYRVAGDASFIIPLCNNYFDLKAIEKLIYAITDICNTIQLYTRNLYNFLTSFLLINLIF